jgi:AraC-like DNA-binding protein
LYFLSPGQIHAWDLTEDVTGYAIMFTNEFFSLDLKDKHVISDLPFLNTVKNTDPVLHVNDEQAATFNDIVQKIKREDHSSVIDRDDVLRAYVRILLIEAKRLYRPTKTTYTAESGVLITKKFLLLIEAHFHAKTLVTEYAKLLGITANHLNETVKRTTGKTAGELIRNRLLLEAKRLLIHSELTISEIADRLNFEDLSYFGRFFKKHTYCSPRDFRRKSMKSAKGA